MKPNVFFPHPRSPRSDYLALLLRLLPVSTYRFNAIWLRCSVSLTFYISLSMVYLDIFAVWLARPMLYLPSSQSLATQQCWYLWQTTIYPWDGNNVLWNKFFYVQRSLLSLPYYDLYYRWSFDSFYPSVSMSGWIVMIAIASHTYPPTHTSPS